MLKMHQNLTFHFNIYNALIVRVSKNTPSKMLPDSPEF